MNNLFELKGTDLFHFQMLKDIIFSQYKTIQITGSLARLYGIQATPHPDPLPIRWGEGIWTAALGQITKQ